MTFLVVGSISGLLLGSVGYVLLIGVLETFFVPPLQSPENYGQFLIVVIGVSFYLTVLGCTFALIPYVRLLGFWGVYALWLWVVWSAEREFFLEVDWLEAPIAAMLLLFLTPLITGVYASNYSKSHTKHQKPQENSNGINNTMTR
ncbi:MAG: hypothetical protein KDB03_11250 [Planctomycetales bacterium]|nr:hypothetical protein [Planctomycetales bacterium]